MLGFLLVDTTLRGDRDSDVKSHVYRLFFTNSVIQQYRDDINLQGDLEIGKLRLAM